MVGQVFPVPPFIMKNQIGAKREQDKYITGWTKKMMSVLRLRWGGGDLEQAEDRLQQEFNDDRILCRWNPLDKNVQIWYVDKLRPYCLRAYDNHFDPSKAAKDMRNMLRPHQELKHLGKEFLQQQNDTFMEKRDSLNYEVGEGLHNMLKGRVITSG